MHQVLALFSKLNFQQSWAKPMLEKYLTIEDQVLVLPFSFWKYDIPNSDAWKQAYSKTGKYYEEICSIFLDFGIPNESVVFANYYEDNSATIHDKIKNSTVLFFPGGAPDLAMQRIKELNILRDIQCFDGLVIGCSAGSMIQCHEFHITPGPLYPYFFYCSGLSLLPKHIGVEVHYKNDCIQLKSINRVVSEKNKTIILIDNNSGAIIENDNLTLLGNAKLYNGGKTNGWNLFSNKYDNEM